MNGRPVSIFSFIAFYTPQYHQSISAIPSSLGRVTLEKEHILTCITWFCMCLPLRESPALLQVGLLTRFRKGFMISFLDVMYCLYCYFERFLFWNWSTDTILGPVNIGKITSPAEPGADKRSNFMHFNCWIFMLRLKVEINPLMSLNFSASLIFHWKKSSLL